MTRCLVTGAYGFIGAHLVAALLAEGYEVVGAGRDLDLGRRLLPDIDWIEADFNRDVEVRAWLPRLEGIDVVLNCVGILQSTFQDNAENIHGGATVALFRACAEAGVPRLIHISAMSAEAEVATSYAQTKVQGDKALKDLDLNWLIVKPSLVVGAGSHGGTSVIRGLAGVPLVTPLPSGGRQVMQPIHMSDLCLGLAKLAASETPSRRRLFATGPETMTLADVVAQHRRWLGFPPARAIALPGWLMVPALKIGDALGYVGTATALRTTSMVQLEHMGHASPQPFAEATGIALQPLSTAMQRAPATLQDRMHARAFFALGLAQAAIALFWIATGALTLLPGAAAEAWQILVAGGLTKPWAGAIVYGGAILDIILGLLFVSSNWLRPAGAMQLMLAGVYLIGGLLYRPDLWLDPLGPLVKVIPIMAATLLVMALSEKR